MRSDLHKAFDEVDHTLMQQALRDILAGHHIELVIQTTHEHVLYILKGTDGRTLTFRLHQGAIQGTLS